MARSIKGAAAFCVLALVAACGGNDAGAVEEFVVVDPAPVTEEPGFTGKYLSLLFYLFRRKAVTLLLFVLAPKRAVGAVIDAQIAAIQRSESHDSVVINHSFHFCSFPVHFLPQFFILNIE